MSTGQQLNYAKAENFSMVLEQFGGKNFLRENFPNMLRMLQNTHEWHQELSENAGEEPAGYEDTFEIVNLYGDAEENDAARASETNILSESSMSLVQKASFLHVSSVIQDPKCGKIFASDAVHDTDANKLKVALNIDRKALRYAQNPCLETKSEFMAVSKVNGKSVCVANRTNKTLTIDLAEGKPDVTSVTVKQPVSQNAGDKLIRVVYNGRSDSNASYNFKMAKDRTYQGTRYVDVYYPFLIEVKLDEDFQYCADYPVSFGDDFMASLASEVVQGGSVHFNTAYIGNIKSSLEDASTLKLEFPYQGGTTANFWGIQMPLTARQTKGEFDFHLQFTVRYVNKSYPDEVFQTPILVTSKDLSPSANMAVVKRAQILWGCLGKDTKLLTEDGYRHITEIRPGDKLYTDKGYIKLKNMVTGTEEKIVAVGVSEGQTLFLTEKHPIATDRGIIYAVDLTISDKLKMGDGSFREIYYLEIMDYNDAVYSPELEESALIVADGFVVGDYLTTADAVEEAEKEPEPLEPELLEELIRWSEYQGQKMKEELAKEEAK